MSKMKIYTIWDKRSKYVILTWEIRECVNQFIFIVKQFFAPSNIPNYQIYINTQKPMFVCFFFPFNH